MKENSEVVHIDYGIILEKGKALKVPEEVQFRLTPNFSQSLDVFQGKTLFFYFCLNVLNAFNKHKGCIYEILESVLNLHNQQNDIINIKNKLERNTFDEMIKLFE